MNEERKKTFPSKIISFSLWGTNERYLKGAFDNIKRAREIYPGWHCRFYVDISSVSKSFYMWLNTDTSHVVEYNSYNHPWLGLFMRFLPAADPTLERFISRDLDSRVNTREKAAVDEWIKSGKPFHAMRDNIAHDIQIMGGMWGCKGGLIPDMPKLIHDYKDKDKKGSDQFFLRDFVWPRVKDNCLIHDNWHRYGTKDNMPNVKSDIGTFVGEIIDVD